MSSLLPLKMNSARLFLYNTNISLKSKNNCKKTLRLIKFKRYLLESMHYSFMFYIYKIYSGNLNVFLVTYVSDKLKYTLKISVRNISNVVGHMLD